MVAPEAMPVPVTLKTKEVLSNNEVLLNPKSAGEQAFWLLGVNPHGLAPNVINDKFDKGKIKESVEKGIPADHKNNINNASLNERTEYWKNQNINKPEDQMIEWKKSMNAFLDGYKNDTMTGTPYNKTSF